MTRPILVSTCAFALALVLATDKRAEAAGGGDLLEQRHAYRFKALAVHRKQAEENQRQQQQRERPRVIKLEHDGP